MDNIHSLIFGFGHRARHGKDSAVKAIIEARGLTTSSDPSTWEGKYLIKRYAFADELKAEVNENAMRAGGMIKLFHPALYLEGGGYWNGTDVIPLPEWVKYDPDPDMTDPMCPYGKQRTLLQWWGTEYRRAVDCDYWVNRVAECISVEKPEIALITDMRLENEVKFCQEYGGTVKVVNPRIAAVHSHATEESLADFEGWDAVIVNDGSLEDLKIKAVKAFDDLMDIPRSNIAQTKADIHHY